MTSSPDYDQLARLWPACQIMYDQLASLMTSLPDDDQLASPVWPACQIMMTSLPDYDYTVPAVNLSFCGTVWQFAVLALLCHTHTHQWAAVFLWNCLQQFAVISIMSIIALYCNKHQIMSRNCCMCMWLPGLALGWSLLFQFSRSAVREHQLWGYVSVMYRFACTIRGENGSIFVGAVQSVFYTTGK